MRVDSGHKRLDLLCVVTLESLEHPEISGNEPGPGCARSRTNLQASKPGGFEVIADAPKHGIVGSNRLAPTFLQP